MFSFRVVGTALFFALLASSCANQQNILYRTVPYESERVQCPVGQYPVNNAYCTD